MLMPGSILQLATEGYNRFWVHAFAGKLDRYLNSKKWSQNGNLKGQSSTTPWREMPYSSNLSCLWRQNWHKAEQMYTIPSLYGSSTQTKSPASLWPTGRVYENTRLFTATCPGKLWEAKGGLKWLISQM